MDEGGDQFDAVTALCSLDDPVRRRLYEHVSRSTAPVTRETAAAAIGVGRTLAAYHLDKLADAGVLTITYARPAGRAGPGAGRPAKVYSRSQRELSVSVPPRNYALLAEVFAEVAAGDQSESLAAKLASVARRAGRSSPSGGDMLAVLRDWGYEPLKDAGGETQLRNCPFHRLAHRHTELVCALNLQLIQGLLEARDDQPSRAVLSPHEQRCCVVVRAAAKRPRTRSPHRPT